MSTILRRTTISLALVATSFTLASHSLAATVFGNLGASGTSGFGGTNTDYGPADTSETSLSQGFSTGASPWLTIESITLGLFVSDASPANRTVSIRSNNAGVPGSSLFTSQAVSVGSTGAYTFPFSSATLSAGTSYWVVPEGPASWYAASGSLFSLPTAQNGSGYAPIDALVLSATSSIWESSQIKSYSISINAVPEPSGMMLSGIGIAAALVFIQRRRRG